MTYKQLQSIYAEKGFSVSYVRGKGYYITHKEVKMSYPLEKGSCGYAYFRVYSKAHLEDIEDVIEGFWEYLPTEIYPNIPDHLKHHIQ